MIVSETFHYILCPHCLKGRNRICHLYGENVSFGGWFCEKCGGCYGGRVDGRNVTVRKFDNRKDNTTVFLRHGRILLACKGSMFGGNSSKYYYNEGTCPSNYMQDVVEVYDLETGESDPHGIFEFLGEVPEMTEKELGDIQPNEIVKKYDPSQNNTGLC